MAKIPFKIMSLQKRDRWFKGVFYGCHGAGKTELGASAVDVPDMCDVFCISAEKGIMTVDETDRIINKDDFFEIPVDDIETCEAVRKWLIAHCMYRDQNDEEKLRGLEERLGFRQPEDTHPARRFRTVMIDTLTEIQQFAMTKTLGISNTLAFDADIPDSEWSHYNKILNRMGMLMRAFRDLPMHVIFLCQEDYKQDQTKKLLYSPMLMGKMGGCVQGYVDVCGRLELVKGSKGEDIRRLWIQPIDKNNAKNRFGKFKDPYIDDATMPRILSALTTGKSLVETE